MSPVESIWVPRRFVSGSSCNMTFLPLYYFGITISIFFQLYFGPPLCFHIRLYCISDFNFNMKFLLCYFISLLVPRPAVYIFQKDWRVFKITCHCFFPLSQVHVGCTIMLMWALEWRCCLMFTNFPFSPINCVHLCSRPLCNYRKIVSVYHSWTSLTGMYVSCVHYGSRCLVFACIFYLVFELRFSFQSFVYKIPPEFMNGFLFVFRRGWGISNWALQFCTFTINCDNIARCQYTYSCNLWTLRYFHVVFLFLSLLLCL